MKATFTVDFEAVKCDPSHLTATGKGWAKRLAELGASKDEISILVDRLKNGMAAQIELSRIKCLAGVNP